MHKLILGAVLALALPVSAAAAAAEEPTPADAAKAACKTEKDAMGTKLFKQTYAAKGTAKAMRACVEKTVPVADAAAKNAAQACKAERKADPAAFAEQYGTNANKKNAYGKCVSGKAQEAANTRAAERANAAKTCKAQKAADTAAFEQAYGPGKSAFGKCVSASAKTDDDEG
jgi:hypothetical protein